MSDLVKVKVLRAHTNDLGTHVEGDEYETTKQHAKLLGDRNIVSVLDEVPDAPAPAEGKADEAPENKAITTAPANKSGKGKAAK